MVEPQNGHQVDRRDIKALIDRLLRELPSSSSEDWANRSLETYLEAMAAWLEDAEGYYANMGRPIPSNAWEIIADALQAARGYE